MDDEFKAGAASPVPVLNFGAIEMRVIDPQKYGRIYAGSDGHIYLVKKHGGDPVRKEWSFTPPGYPLISVPHWHPVHVLVAKAWHGDPPDGTSLIRHLNSIKTDPRPSNLAYGTAKENQHDSIALGTHASQYVKGFAAGHRAGLAGVPYREALKKKP